MTLSAAGKREGERGRPDSIKAELTGKLGGFLGFFGDFLGDYTLLFPTRDHFLHDLEAGDLSFVPCFVTLLLFFLLFAKVSAAFTASLARRR